MQSLKSLTWPHPERRAAKSKKNLTNQVRTSDLEIISNYSLTLFQLSYGEFIAFMHGDYISR